MESKSNLDIKNESFFKNNDSCATLHSIKLEGQLRGLKDCVVEFEYPISVFAGKNGCGKTTLLALAACAYHNKKKGYYSSKSRNYYTFSDFFIQSASELKPSGIDIWYKFLHNNWSNSKAGMGLQRMKKAKGGKWSKYEKRIKKNVVFLGIDRVVPQSERQVYKTYRSLFKEQTEKNAWYNDVSKIVGKILSKKYESYSIQKAGNYKLPIVKEASCTYSGFNMGAGEKALFELFSTIHDCTQNEDPCLIIIDEIELGLHEEAQRKLIEVLKEMAIPKKLQIICTTHSPSIIESLPPKARYYIDKVAGKTEITQGISGKYAAGKLAEKNSNELDVYIEDETAQLILESILSLEQRKRINLIPIGSYSAVSRSMSLAYKHPRLKDQSICIYDGDQRGNNISLVDLMIKNIELSTDVEKTKFRDWVKDRINFLNGKTWPEKWILETVLQHINSEVAKYYGTKVGHLKECIEKAILADKHDEFYTLGQLLSINDYDVLKREFIKIIQREDPSVFENISKYINRFLL